jgi:hypothetical protein
VKRLSRVEVAGIEAALSAGLGQARVAELYGHSRQTISVIARKTHPLQIDRAALRRLGRRIRRGAEGPLELDLKPAHRRRYLEVCAAKVDGGSGEKETAAGNRKTRAVRADPPASLPQQQWLFDPAPPPWELDELDEARVSSQEGAA